MDFGEPFLADVFKGSRRRDGKADEEDIGLGIRQGTQSIVILLTGGIKKSKGIRLIADPVEQSVEVDRQRMSRRLT